MFKKIPFALIILALLLVGCSPTLHSAPSPELPQTVVGERQSAESAAGIVPAPQELSAYAQDQTATSVDRLVIKNASLSIAVNDPAKSMETISHMADAMGGYVVSANMYQTTLQNGAQVPQVSLTIRVPAERLDEALATIKAEATQPVISENVSSQDVTADYTDLNSRLTNLRVTEAQLQEIMTDATKTEDVLAVYSQLSSVRGEIEQIEGQMQYYETSAKLSSISVELIPNAAVQPLTIAGWQPAGVAKQAVQSLINTLQKLANFGIRLVINYIPVLIIIFGPIALIIWGIVSWIRKGRKRRLAPPPSPQA